MGNRPDLLLSEAMEWLGLVWDVRDVPVYVREQKASRRRSEYRSPQWKVRPIRSLHPIRFLRSGPLHGLSGQLESAGFGHR